MNIFVTKGSAMAVVATLAFSASPAMACWTNENRTTMLRAEKPDDGWAASISAKDNNGVRLFKVDPATFLVTQPYLSATIKTVSALPDNTKPAEISINTRGLTSCSEWLPAHPNDITKSLWLLGVVTQDSFSEPRQLTVIPLPAPSFSEQRGYRTEQRRRDRAAGRMPPEHERFRAWELGRYDSRCAITTGSFQSDAPTPNADGVELSGDFGTGISLKVRAKALWRKDAMAISITSGKTERMDIPYSIPGGQFAFTEIRDSKTYGYILFTGSGTRAILGTNLASLDKVPVQPAPYRVTLDNKELYSDTLYLPPDARTAFAECLADLRG